MTSWQHVGPADLFDLAAIQDPDTLHVIVTSDVIHEGVRTISLSFTSQEWHGTTWRHPARVYVPEHRTGHGCAGIVSTEADLWTNPDHERARVPETGRPTEAEYARATAVSLGIPVMIYATPPDLGMNESDLNGYANRKLFETGDFTWYGYYPIAVSHLRAAALLRSLPGLGAHRSVILGHSKRGLGAAILTGLDTDLVAGIMTTGTNGMNMLEATTRKYAQLGPDVAGPSARRGGLGFQTADAQLRMFNNPLGFETIKRFDPYFWRESITLPWFVVNGTNDPFFAVDVTQTMRHAQGPTTVLAVDNVGHTWVSQKILEAWRMWLAHLAAGRAVPGLEVTAEREAGHLAVRLRACGPVTAARLVTATNRGDDWRSVPWSTTTLAAVGPGRHEGLIALPEDDNLAWYVEAETGDPTGRGFVSNAVRIEHGAR
ncbi:MULTISPECIES: PhoPQ-activated protein PqaA family protein [unclassified Nonomuraea]|uniref:PhoPQ-activated protein PqaA family protein n=1 Tax=unclassified Nonomuraea TaxID=2593643 RepID=UPI0034090685